MNFLKVIGGALTSWLGGKGGPKAPNFGPPPTMDDVADWLDLVSGTQFVTKTGADGKKQRVLERLPRTKEEEEFFKGLQESIKESMDFLHTALTTKNEEVQEKYQGMIEAFGTMNNETKKDFATVIGGDVPTAQKFEEELNTFKSGYQEIMDRKYREAENRTMEKLIENGHLDSSAANEMKAQLAHNKMQGAIEVEMASDRHGRDLTQDRFNRDMDIYNTERQQRYQDYEGRNNIRKNEYNKKALEYAEAVNASKEDISNHKLLFDIADDQQKNDDIKAMNSIAPAGAQNEYNNLLRGYQAKVGAQQQNYQNQIRQHQNSFRYQMGKIGANIMGQGLEGLIGGGESNNNSSFNDSPSWGYASNSHAGAGGNGWRQDINGTQYRYN